ncbi:solute carrier family 35 member E3-like isoform X1 [Amblyomma americanum]
MRSFFRALLRPEPVGTHCMPRQRPRQQQHHRTPANHGFSSAHQRSPSSLAAPSAAETATGAAALEGGGIERRYCDDCGAKGFEMGQSADESSQPLLGPAASMTALSSALATAESPSRQGDYGDCDLPSSPVSSVPWRRTPSYGVLWRLASLLTSCCCGRTSGGSGGFAASLAVTLVSVLNLSLAVAVLLTCKLSYDQARLPNLTLTLVHLAASLAALRATSAFNVSWAPRPTSESGGDPNHHAAQAASRAEHWKLAFLLCAFMALPNLSLEFNTAGTSLLLRLLSLPVTTWLQATVYGRRQRRGAVLSLLPVALGVALNAKGDLRFNAVGVVFGVAGAVASAFYFTLSAEQQRSLRQAPWLLLEAQLQRAIPMLALVALVLEPPWRPPRGAFVRHWHGSDVGLLVGSSLAGCLLTLSMQWLLGRTSALTYQVLGHVKMCATLLACAVFLDEQLKPLQQAGVLLTLSGAVIYTVSKARDQTPSSSHHGSQQPLLAASSPSQARG